MVVIRSFARILYLQNIVLIFRERNEHPYSLIDPPPHPTYDLYETVQAALVEDAGDLGDITTLSTYETKR